jgi:AraC-like DNA-binding protein
MLSRRGDRQVKYLLIGFIILLLTSPLNAYIQLISANSITWLTILSQKLTWAYGPILIALLAHITLKPLTRSQFILLLSPFVLVLIHEIFHINWLSFHSTTLVLFVQVFSSLGYASYLLFNAHSRINALLSEFKQSSYYWLIFIVLMLSIIMLVDLSVYTAVLRGALPPITALAAFAGAIGLLVNGIALFSLYQPDTFVQPQTAEELDIASPEKMPLRSIELSPAAALELSDKLDAIIAHHKPHLDESISLSKLASLLGVTNHQLSELLNIYKETNFYDFLNNLRHQEAMNMLTNTYQSLSITDIAYRSGFNNRNSFYKVFKAKTGLTPSEYKKSLG